MSLPKSWLVTVALALVAGSTPAETLAVIPVQKVLDMLGQMNVTAAAAKQEQPKVLVNTKSELMILQPNLDLRSRLRGETLRNSLLLSSRPIAPLPYWGKRSRKLRRGVRRSRQR